MSRDKHDRWEYKTLRPARGETKKEAEAPQAQINELATEGWRLVVTIGQFVLSQENGPFGDQRERMENSMGFRDYAEELICIPTPSDPSAFLRSLVNVAEERAKSLRDGLDEINDEQLH